MLEPNNKRRNSWGYAAAFHPAVGCLFESEQMRVHMPVYAGKTAAMSYE